MEDLLRSLPGYSLKRASAAMLDDLNRRLVALDLRHTDAAILVLVNGNRGVTQSELGRALAIQRANMTPIVGRLVDLGLVERLPLDGRSQGLGLTGAGIASLAQVQAAMAEHEALISGKIKAGSLETFKAALDALWV
jgi:DNA-binding MarR family transcriptional regulator